MPAKAVIEDMDQFLAFLAAQPLCAWSAQKQREHFLHETRPTASVHPHSAAKPAKKSDNAVLAAALASMA